jgi:hypothetical protein
MGLVWEMSGESNVGGAGPSRAWVTTPHARQGLLERHWYADPIPCVLKRAREILAYPFHRDTTGDGTTARRGLALCRLDPVGH